MPIKRIYPAMSMQSTSTTVSASSASASSVSAPVFLRRYPWDAGQEQILVSEVRSPDRCMDITEPDFKHRNSPYATHFSYSLLQTGCNYYICITAGR